jgi:putative ABC transport system permease protein
MNVVSRGIKNALRSPLRSGGIVLMLAISIGLILSMLVARGSVETKIASLQSTTGTTVTITPATIQKTKHVASIVATLSDQLGSTDTNLTSSLTLGSFGARQARFDAGSSSSSFAGGTGSGSTAAAPTMTPHITVTGTTNPNSVATNGGTLKITSGTTINGSSSSYVALVGSSLATKNSLSAGSNFTAYGQTFTVSGIYSTGNTFQDSGIIMPLATVQNLSSQVGDVTSVTATVDSSSNVNSTVTNLKTELGTTADITSEATEAAASVSSLSSISNLALAGVIGASIAGAIIVLLAMVMIVRERRREIGVIKAIGGTNGKVIGQFMTEALTLTVIGGIVGLVLGVLVSGPVTTSLVSSNSTTTATTTGAGGGFGGGAGRGFTRAFNGGVGQVGTNIKQVTASLTPQIFIAAVGIVLVIAIIGSAIPAWLIARVRPAEVLRTE